MDWASLFGDLENIQEDAQPLSAHWFRYDSKSRCWRSSAVGSNGMPRKAGPKSISKKLGVPEALLREWEEAYLRQWCSLAVNTAAEALRVGVDGDVKKNALLPWNLQYFPSSRTWRRARSARDEVPRERVAVIAGVDLSLIDAWEKAVHAITKETPQRG
jgi:hypothetical protein